MRKEAPHTPGSSPKRKADTRDILRELGPFSWHFKCSLHPTDGVGAGNWCDLTPAYEGFPEHIFSIRPRVVCQWIADLRDSHRITNHHSHHYWPLIGQSVSMQASHWSVSLNAGLSLADAILASEGASKVWRQCIRSCLVTSLMVASFMIPDCRDC